MFRKKIKKVKKVRGRCLWAPRPTALDGVIVRNSPNLANCSLANESVWSGVGSPSASFYWPSYLTNEITVFNQPIKSKCQLANQRVLSNQVIRSGGWRGGLLSRGAAVDACLSSSRAWITPDRKSLDMGLVEWFIPPQQFISKDSPHLSSSPQRFI